MDQNMLHVAAGRDAFGDGRHPTTAGALAALESVDPAAFMPRNACDIGCGSGILSLAILRLFQCPVIAADIAQSAVEATRANALQNAVPTADLKVVQADGFNHPAITAAAPFALVTINILAEPLLALAADAERHLAAGGVLILSGILRWQEAPLLAAYQGLGLECTARLSIGDWVTLIWQKPEGVDSPAAAR